MKDWSRVSHSRPCTICGKTDWCTFTATGAACCMRVPSDRQMANGGYLHNAHQTHKAAPCARSHQKTYEDPDFDAACWWQAVRRVTSIEKLEPWADQLGLHPGHLDWMGACVLGKMLAFPMYDGRGQVCGIRTRLPSGEKRAVTGSRAGVLLPRYHLDGHGLDPLICEGPTDAAAAIALGFEPIGRPSCVGCEIHVADTCRRFGYARVTICADADGPGIAGARKLADLLRAARIAVRLVTPGGHKDLRDWWKSVIRRADVDAAWSQAEWRG